MRGETNFWKLLPHPQTPAEALACQERLRSRVRLQPLPAPPRLIAGVDAAYSKIGQEIFGAAVVMSLPELAVIETATAAGTVSFPYFPGLFSFREAPILRAALEKISQSSRRCSRGRPRYRPSPGTGPGFLSGTVAGHSRHRLRQKPPLRGIWRIGSGSWKFYSPQVGGETGRVGTAVAPGRPAFIHFPRSLNNAGRIP